MDHMVRGGLSPLDGVEHYRIDGVERMEPFLMTVVSDTDLWMFVSSTGALTAGRVDADHAIFPYETDDRLHRAVGITGPVTVIARQIDGRRELWRPFAAERSAACTRSLAKSVLGDRLVFEEHHDSWGLRFRATWEPSATHGWVRTVEIVDAIGLGAELEVLDGLLDVMPAGVPAHTEQTLSNLVNSYKRSETGSWGTLAVYTLEALITDRAEPAESLTATSVWSSRIPRRRARPRRSCGRSDGAGGTGASAGVAHGSSGRIPVAWSGERAQVGIGVMDDGRRHRSYAFRGPRRAVHCGQPRRRPDRQRGHRGRVARDLRALLAGADADQSTADRVADAHHLSNVLFNCMRGGVFPHGHRVPVADLVEFVRARNHDVADRPAVWLQSLGRWADVAALRAGAVAIDDNDLTRLVLRIPAALLQPPPRRPQPALEPLLDPGSQRRRRRAAVATRATGVTSSRTGKPCCSLSRLSSQHVIAMFVNASTVDGYNPYRITRAGIDWEVADPATRGATSATGATTRSSTCSGSSKHWERHEPGRSGAGSIGRSSRTPTCPT